MMSHHLAAEPEAGTTNRRAAQQPAKVKPAACRILRFQNARNTGQETSPESRPECRSTKPDLDAGVIPEQQGC